MKLQTRKQRATRILLKRIGIGIFLVLFALSIAGGLALITINPH